MLTGDSGLYMMAFAFQRQQSLTLIFHKTEDNPRQENGKWVEYIRGEVCFFLNSVQAFEMRNSDFQCPQEQKQFEENGLYRRDILAFDVDFKTSPHTYFLITTGGEELSFSSSAEPVIAYSDFSKSIHERKYVEMNLLKYGLIAQDFCPEHLHFCDETCGD
jgi:hypothetical protein